MARGPIDSSIGFSELGRFQTHFCSPRRRPPHHARNRLCGVGLATLVELVEGKGPIVNHRGSGLNPSRLGDLAIGLVYGGDLFGGDRGAADREREEGTLAPEEARAEDYDFKSAPAAQE